MRQGIREATIAQLFQKVIPESEYVHDGKEVDVHNALIDLLTVWYDCGDNLREECKQEFRTKFRELRKAILASEV